MDSWGLHGVWVGGGLVVEGRDGILQSGLSESVKGQLSAVTGQWSAITAQFCTSWPPGNMQSSLWLLLHVPDNRVTYSNSCSRVGGNSCTSASPQVEVVALRIGQIARNSSMGRFLRTAPKDDTGVRNSLTKTQ